MAQGGGRGWFHRKRSQPNLDEHADSALQARTGQEPRETGSSQPALDQDFQQWSPEVRRGIADDQPPTNRPAPAMDADAVTRQEPFPGRADADRPVSVDPTLRPRPNETDSGAAPAAPVVPTWAAPAGSGAASDRIEPAPAPSERPSAPGSAAHTSGIDWDAATAAALSEEPVHGHPTTDADGGPPSNADRLLEDIIREIVGDAAADTVSSLGAPRTEALLGHSESVPANGSPPDSDAEARSPEFSDETPPADLAESAPAPELPPTDALEILTTGVLASGPHPGAGTPGTDLGTVAGPGVIPDPGGGVDAGGARPEPGKHPESREDPESDEKPETARYRETVIQGSGEQLRVPAEAPLEASRPDVDDSDPAPEATRDEWAPVHRPVDIPAEAVDDIPREPVVAAAPMPTSIDGLIAAQHHDVSRETSHDYGGTPLAYELADETRRRIALDEAVLPLPPATRIFTISNQKGGVGKTTSAVNLAAALARSGARVLVIDLDPQGNASTALGVDHRSERQSVYEVLVSDLSLGEVIQPSTEHERLDCVPATIHLAGAEIELVSLVAREQRLRRALDAHLASMEKPYDYVFIDCPPSLGLLTINAFVAAREVLIPIQCEYYALEGLSQLLSNIELIEKHLNPELRLSTILLTMYDSRTNLAQQVAQEVRDHFPTETLQTIIPRSVRVSEAPSYGQSVISYDYASSGSLSYREAAAEIARRSVSNPKESH